MKIFFHFSVIGFSNTYLIGSSDGGDAILIDPGHMDIELLRLIEDNNFYIRHILLTHHHKSHTEGLKTLMKIYKADIYANSPYIYDFQVHPVADKSEMTLSGIRVNAFLVPGHSSDSLIYKIEDAMFTGDVVMSARLGSTDSTVSMSLLKRSLGDLMKRYDNNTILFPGHGAPTTIGVEKLVNSEFPQP